jgi:DNA-binding NtrC family response regulator
MGSRAGSGGPSPTESSQPDARALRVLIIDDEQPVRAALSRYFVRKGWLAEGIGDAHAALAMLRDAPADSFDAILTDMSMPGMGGAALHDALREQRPDFYQRLIIATGDLSSADAVELRARSERPFVAKPFDFSSLMAIVTSVAHGER